MDEVIIGAVGNRLYVYQPKIRDQNIKYLYMVNIEIQLKHCNTRSCIQISVHILGLHPQIIFCYPGHS